jgi:ankyrin repeat protein
MTHPLFGALSNPRVDVLQALQKAHLDDLASLDPDGFTLLHAAAHLGRQDAVQYLVTDGFLPLVGDYEGNLQKKTPLHLAAESGSLATVQWLLREAQSRADALDWRADTALHRAAHAGQLSVVRWLVDSDLINVHAKNHHDCDVLHKAVHGGHLSTVQWLLAGGFGLSSSTSCQDGLTPLLCAASGGHLAMVQWLLSEGGSLITEQNDHGYTALLCAAGHGQVETVRWLIEDGGANPRDVTTDGFTVLLLAAVYSHLTLVQWLLASGNSVVDEVTNDGRSALSLAYEHGRSMDILTFPKPGPSPFLANWLLATGGADPSVGTNFSGTTVLHRAACRDDLWFAKRLVDSGRVTIQQRTGDGESALVMATAYGSTTMVQWMIRSAGGQVTDTDAEGNNLLTVALKHGSTDTAEWLLVNFYPTIADMPLVTLTRMPESSRILLIAYEFVLGPCTDGDGGWLADWRRCQLTVQTLMPWMGHQRASVMLALEPLLPGSIIVLVLGYTRCIVDGVAAVAHLKMSSQSDREQFFADLSIGRAATYP